MVSTYFQTYASHLVLSVDNCFNAARMEQKLLSRDGVISTIVLLRAEIFCYYTSKKKQRQKRIVRVVSEGGICTEIRTV